MNKTTKVIIGAVVLVLIVGIVWYSNKNQQPVVKNETIKIGAILPLTGTAATQGESIKNAIGMAVDEKNAKGGVNGKKIELIIEDSTMSAEKAVSIVNKFINVDKIKFVLGPITSSEIAAVAPIIDNTDAIMISFGGGSSPYSKYGKNAFTTSAVYGFEVPKMIGYMLEKGYKKIALLGVKTDSMIQVQEILKRELPNKNINLVASELMDATDKDFKTNLLKIKEAKPDAIYLNHYPALNSLILKQMKELQIDIPVLSFYNIEDPAAQTNGIDLLKGIVYTIPIRQEAGKKYFEKYELKYGKKAVVVSDSSYDAANLLMDAIQKSEDVGKIREYLQNVKNYDGAGGVFSIDENKDAKRDYVVKIFE